MIIPDKLKEMALQQGPVVVLLLCTIVSGWSGYWVFGRVYDDVRADRDFERKRAEGYRSAFDKLTERAEQRAQWRRSDRRNPEAEAKEDEAVTAEVKRKAAELEKSKP